MKKLCKLHLTMQKGPYLCMEMKETPFGEVGFLDFLNETVSFWISVHRSKLIWSCYSSKETSSR